jgi:hypothetical protein
MDVNEMAQEITHLKIRCEIYEALLAKLSLASWLAIPGTAPQEARAETLSEFEAIAEGIRKSFSSSLDASEKALYSDDLQKIVEHMKSYVMILTKGK